MRLCYQSSKGHWIVELSDEEVKMLDPSFDTQWKVNFMKGLKDLNLDTRATRKLIQAAYYGPKSQATMEHFSKAGRLLSFEEWAVLPDLEQRLQKIRGVGPVMAKQIVEAIQKLFAISFV